MLTVWFIDPKGSDPFWQFECNLFCLLIMEVFKLFGILFFPYCGLVKSLALHFFLLPPFCVCIAELLPKVRGLYCWVYCRNALVRCWVGCLNELRFTCLWAFCYCMGKCYHNGTATFIQWRSVIQWAIRFNLANLFYLWQSIFISGSLFSLLAILAKRFFTWHLIFLAISFYPLEIRFNQHLFSLRRP